MVSGQVMAISRSRILFRTKGTKKTRQAQGEPPISLLLCKEQLPLFHFLNKSIESLKRMFDRYIDPVIKVERAEERQRTLEILSSTYSTVQKYSRTIKFYGTR